ncbi:MAG: sensor histidine kinase [Arachnia sp.]
MDDSPGRARDVAGASSPGTMNGGGPWSKYGWLIGGVWVVFLLLPARAIVAAAVPAAGTAAALGSLLVFAVVYLIGCRRTYGAAYRPGDARSWIILAVMLLTTGAVAVVTRLDAVGMAMFIMSYALFAFTWRISLVLAISAVVVTFVVPLAAGQSQPYLFLGMICLLLGVATAISRISVERGKRLDQEHEVIAVMGERDRVARDVHDVLGHTLTVIAVKTELAERLVFDDPHRAAAELAQIHALTRDAIFEVRATVAGLRTRDLDAELLVAAEALRAAGITAALPQQTTQVRHQNRALFAWVVREGVTNAIRHCQGSTVAVELGEDFVTVTDDGIGWHGEQGQGLRGLRGRVEDAHGSLTIDNSPDGGLRLHVEMSTHDSLAAGR